MTQHRAGSQERQLARTPGGASVGTPSVGTPLSSGQSTPARGGAARDEGHRAAFAAALADAAAAAGAAPPTDLRLDAFLVRLRHARSRALPRSLADADNSCAVTLQARYTSEDNASFNALLAKVNAARREAACPAAALAAEASAAAHTSAMRALGDAPRPAAATDEFGTSGQPFAGVLCAPFVAKNALFYAPEGRQLSLREAEARVKGPPRAVQPHATRFGGAAEPPPAQPRSGAATPGLRGCVASLALAHCAATLQSHTHVLICVALRLDTALWRRRRLRRAWVSHR